MIRRATPSCRKDETDGKDYLIELDGHPLAGDQVKPTGTRYPVDGDGIRLLSPVIPPKVYGLAKNYEAYAQFMHEAGHSEIAHAPEGHGDLHQAVHLGNRARRSDCVPGLLQDMNFEPEVAVVMGRIAKNVVRRERDGLRARLHLRERRDVARSAGHRPHVDARQRASIPPVRLARGS